ncbi:hypothetical protein [Erythrobacter sp. F6033]|uniref:hypothetical protein n=1 Tax=Erythrobacter sp. F6033 TaxID=2926401 RepID=UPI001FF1D7CC|nr:hypothetical protein [Erythrobacter sp. F6033]MCK0127601.1 hypothetical protein [Erythrobacter sp. F6033]
MFRWLEKAINKSRTTVITAPGALKIHNVEAKFRSASNERRSPYGKLSQDRWNDGQERFSLTLRNLPNSHGGKVRLLTEGNLVAEFDVSGSTLKFQWKGYSSENIPLIAIGDRVTIEAGSTVLSAIVEAD